MVKVGPCSSWWPSPRARAGSPIKWYYHCGGARSRRAGCRNGGPAPHPQEPDFARPLAIQMEALLWLHGASPGTGERGIAPMIDRMVDLERKHWKKVTEGFNATLDRGVAQVTAVRGVEGRERAIVLVKEDSASFGPRTKQTAAAVVRELAKLYGENIQEGPSSGIDVVVGLLAQQPARRYAKRMLIENALADAVRFFHIDALSSSVGFKVDFDMALLVLASALYRLTARRMRGYDDAQARQIFRDLVDMPADVAVTPAEVRVRFHRRAHLPIVLASGLIDKPVTVPWWQGRSLRLVQ